MKPTPDNIEELLDLACNSGGSGDGLSHYTVANRCGMRAYLQMQQRATRQEEDHYVSSLTDKSNALRLGSAYHKLHEWWSEGALDDFPSVFATQFEDPNFQLAMRLFEAYTMQFGRRYWGEVLGSEWLMPASQLALAANKLVFDGSVVNAKPDRVVRISEADLRDIDRVQLPGQGVYVVDFKTSGMDHDPLFWQTSLQAAWYPMATKMECPEWNVRGTIFDVVRKPTRKNDPVTFEAHFVPYNHERALQLLKPFVAQGAKKIEEARDKGIGNPSECVTVKFNKDAVCSFFGNECTFTRGAA